MLFVDMDGVLADFDRHYFDLFGVVPDKKLDNVDWKKVNEVGNFYITMRPMADMHKLWDYVRKYKPIVLTGVPENVKEAAHNKISWGKIYLGTYVKVLPCPSKKKWTFCTPGDILIDDWEKYKDLWVQAGGTWITHKNANQTIRELKRHGL